LDTRNNFEEVVPEGTAPEEIPQVLSVGKSFGFHRELADGEILLTADTIVICGGEVMGKPHSAEDAAAMLRKLSGKAHKVITAVTLRDRKSHRTFSDTATVHFAHLTEDEITYYINRYHPFDKAGAYGIQEWIGHIGIERIEGSFFTIMGLPIHLVYRNIADLCR
ncbi:MAG: Maf family protein, partial [Candidatus Cryptobacteroides sp.]